MKTMRLEVVVADNGLGGALHCTEEDGVVSGEVVIMQRSYTHIEGYMVEETRITKLIDDIGRMILEEFSPGKIMEGNIVMKQRIGYAPGYSKIRGYNNRLLRDSEGNIVWGRTYYTLDEEDRDELIVSAILE